MLDKEYIKRFPKWQQELIIEYEEMFKYINPESHYPIKYGFECREGWIILIKIFLARANQLTTKLDENLGATPARSKPRITQVKEKFGGLRIYVEFQDGASRGRMHELWGLQYGLEEVSFHTCEICGRPGTLRENEWIRVRCEWCEIRSKMSYILHWPSMVILKIKNIVSSPWEE